MKKKLQVTIKEKALLKLEKDKLQKKAHALQTSIKAEEQKVQEQIMAAQNRQRQSNSPDNIKNHNESMSMSTLGRATKNTPYPEDARPNPYLARQFEPLTQRL